VTAGFTDYFTTPAFVHEYLDFLARSNDYTSTQSLLISPMMPLVNCLLITLWCSGLLTPDMRVVFEKVFSTLPPKVFLAHLSVSIT